MSEPDITNVYCDNNNQDEVIINYNKRTTTTIKQESRAAARKPRDAATFIYGFNCHIVSFSLQFL